MLLSSLARISKLVGSGRHAHAAMHPDAVHGLGVTVGLSLARGQDLGEVISRDALSGGDVPASMIGMTATSVRESFAIEANEAQVLQNRDDKAEDETRSVERTAVVANSGLSLKEEKRRRRRGESENAIDALFRGLP